jgi:hypothetical protein
MKFSNWFFLRESAEGNVSGEGVKALQSIMRDMASRGIPNEYNDYGFNKQDWNAYQSLEASGHIDSASVPMKELLRMLQIISHYQNTQIRNYRSISDLVKKDIDSANPSGNQATSDKIYVYDRQPLEYGKVKVYIPRGLDRSSVILINRIVDSKLAQEGEKKTVDNYGKETYPRYKKIQAVKSEMHMYRIHKSVLDPILDILTSKGIEVEYESGTPYSSQGASSQGPTTDQSSRSTTEEPDIEILGKESNRWGNKIAVSFNYERSKGLYQKMKGAGLTPKGISYDYERKVFLINIDDKSMFDKVVDIARQSGLDVSPLEEFAKTMGQTDQPATGEEPKGDGLANKEGIIRFTDAAGDAINVKTDVRGLPQEVKDFVRESIQYTFPEYKYDMTGHFYTISGDFKQYSTFGRLLKKFNYPVDELRAIIRAKLDSGRLNKTEWEGKFDKDKAFQDSIEEKVPDSVVDLYDEQKFGVAFLYGRDSAILGDETGFGKSIQLITAAALRMKSNNKPTLIITLKATQQQFAKEILRVMGEKIEDMSPDQIEALYKKHGISLSPTTPNKWTVIRYSDFSGGAGSRNDTVKNHVESLKKAGFGVAILDELHKVKHGKSQRSENVSSVVSGIPTRWGASATVSSNKPMDVKNQLLMMGHQLGRIKESKFKKDFAGMVADGYGGAFVKSKKEEDEIRAAERLNKWLNLSGVYVRREKGDIREMPELTVGSDSTGIDPTRFQDIYSEKVREYQSRRAGQPVLAVSKLIAARLAVAQLKTDESTKKALDIVAAGEGKPPAASKIVVFTNFVEAGRQLVSKISDGLKKINPKYSVLTYLSDTSRKERDQVKSKFTNDPDLKVLVMSMKMGGTGIDFPNASQNMIINDFDWTPESAEQSEGRIYRINTDHPVKISYVIGHGLDAELFQKVQRKREIAAIIQKYRREYHDSESAPEALKKIVDAQKEMKKLDDDMVSIVAKNLPGAEGALQKESFSSYLEKLQEIRDALMPLE